MDTKTHAAMQMCAGVDVQVTVVTWQRRCSPPPSDAIRRPMTSAHLAG